MSYLENIMVYISNLIQEYKDGFQGWIHELIIVLIMFGFAVSAGTGLFFVIVIISRLAGVE